MSYTMYGPDGTPLSGEAFVSQPMRTRCDEVGGYIQDDSTGQRVYPQATREDS